MVDPQDAETVSPQPGDADGPIPPMPRPGGADPSGTDPPSAVGSLPPPAGGSAVELPPPPEAGTGVELPPAGSGLQPDPYVYSQPLSVPVVDPQSLRGATGGMPPPPVAMPAQSYRWDFRPVAEGEVAGGNAGPAGPASPMAAPGEVPTGYQPIAPLPLMPAPQYLQSPAVTAVPTKLVTAVWILAVASLCQTVAIIWLALR